MTEETELGIELLSAEPMGLPPRRPIEPFERKPKGGKWRCDPKFINVLTLDGRNLPYKSVVFYRALEISWSPTSGAAPYTTACPLQTGGGVFPQLKLHALVYGLGTRGVGCATTFAIEGSPGQPVWVTVNDTNFADNTGMIAMEVSWD